MSALILTERSSRIQEINPNYLTDVISNKSQNYDESCSICVANIPLFMLLMRSPTGRWKNFVKAIELGS